MTTTEQATTPETGASGAGPLTGSASDAPAGAHIDGEPQTEAPEGGSTGEPQNGSEGHLPREARYRVERNEARAQVEALQTREVERLAADHLSQPGDLLALGGVTLAELLGEDGFVDPEAVAEAAAALILGRPGLAKNPRVAATDPTQGRGGGPLAPSRPTEFSGMFGP